METMLRYHMAVVTPDKRLKRAIKRVTTATASTAEFVTALDGLSGEPAVDLAILDARDSAPSKKQLKVLPDAASISYILNGENLIHTVDMLEDKRVNSLLCHDETFDDDEFIASATKALRRDIFGLQKYFPWGVTTYSMVVKNYEQKTRAIEIIMEYARQAGLRGPVRDRIQLVSDELMMNALYHAPVDKDGNERYAKISRKDLTKLDEVQAIEVHYGCSGRYFGLSIRDTGGSLNRRKALEYLMRAKNETTQIETKATGAGLGLISVLRSVSKLIFNLDPGSSTEVIALFDMNLFSRGKVGARSLHIFTAEALEGHEQEDGQLEGADAPALPEPHGSNRWSLVALLLALLAIALGVAYFMRDNVPNQTTVEAVKPTITVVPTPADAVIQINGTPMKAGAPVLLPAGTDTFKVVVTKRGYRRWTKELTRDQVRGPIQLYVPLEHKR